MGFADLQGALARLKLVTPATLAPLHAVLQDDQWFTELALLEPPSRERLERLLADNSLIVWEVYPQASRERAGYFGVARNTGAAQLLVIWPGREPAADLELLADCLAVVVPAFFRNLFDNQLLVVVERDLDAGVRPILASSGFAVLKDQQAWDRKKYTAYALARSTFARGAGGKAARR